MLAGGLALDAVVGGEALEGLSTWASTQGESLSEIFSNFGGFL